MAVVPMQQITLLGLQRDRKKLLEFVQRKGVVEVTAEGEAPPGFTRSDSIQRLAHLDRCSRTVAQALEVLQKYERGCAVNEPLLKYRVSNTGKSGSKLHSAKLTFRTYRYLGMGMFETLICFASYALNGVKKYFRWFVG